MSNKRCQVGGVDRSGNVDRISIQNAVETPFWMALWATEPERPIDVRMSYSDLKIICDLIDKKREQKHMNDGWIPVEERLPQEKINPVSQDFCEYQVTARFEGLLDVRHYKYGRGHWWNGPGIVDRYVVAWRENPAPYKPTKGDVNGQE